MGFFYQGSRHTFLCVFLFHPSVRLLVGPLEARYSEGPLVIFFQSVYLYGAQYE